MIEDQAVISKGNHLEQREKLGLSRAPKPRPSRAPHPEPTNSLQKVEVCNFLVSLYSITCRKSASKFHMISGEVLLDGVVVI